MHLSKFVMTWLLGCIVSGLGVLEWNEVQRSQAKEVIFAVPQAANQKRAWGPEQVEGPPDTMQAGDIQTAWASAVPDGQEEWLICEYAEAVQPAAVVVHETFNPGAVIKVSAFDADDREVEVWAGIDPTKRDAGQGASVIPIKTKFKVRTIKIYIDSVNVPGWNEIDAVGLRDAAGKTQWAQHVEASSTFGEQPNHAASRAKPIDLVRLHRLDKEVKQLRKDVDRLKALESEVETLRAQLKEQRQEK